jgi:hypothetical protein
MSCAIAPSKGRARRPIRSERLHDYLPELKGEVARTDSSELRHARSKRQMLCERLIDELAPPPRRQ